MSHSRSFAPPTQQPNSGAVQAGQRPGWPSRPLRDRCQDRASMTEACGRSPWHLTRRFRLGEMGELTHISRHDQEPAGGKLADSWAHLKRLGDFVTSCGPAQGNGLSLSAVNAGYSLTGFSRSQTFGRSKSCDIGSSFGSRSTEGQLSGGYRSARRINYSGKSSGIPHPHEQTETRTSTREKNTRKVITASWWEYAVMASRRRKSRGPVKSGSFPSPTPPCERFQVA